MTCAILADIKANAPALRAVLAALDRLHIDRVWVIGSSFAAGADPHTIADLLFSSTHADRVLVGHPDGHILGTRSLEQVNPSAQRGFRWAHRQLTPRWLAGIHARRRWRWLQSRPCQATEGHWMFCSGTPLYPDGDFLPGVGMPGHTPALKPHFDAIAKYAAVASLGRPGYARVEDLRWQSVDGTEPSLNLSGQKVIMCPGSVGQPRDRDPRAAFVVVDGDRITFHRVAYDIEEAARRIRACAALPDRNAERLFLGV